jgi:hypothetical protein
VNSSRAGDSKQAQESDISHFMKPPAVVARLCPQYGEPDARKIAFKQQRKAKRARSKKRFVFWAEVARHIGKGD